MAFPRKMLNGLRELVQNALLPTGAIVWFKRETAPAGWVICDGTNGTPDLIGRYPLGSKTDIGTTVEAGLPDITGTFGGHNNTPSGAFYKLGGSEWHGNRNNNGQKCVVYFAASKSNSIYGKSATVTPASTKLLPCMKL